MKQLVKKDVEKSDSKTYFMYVSEDAQFINSVKIQFGLSNSELGKYCLDLLKAVIKFPEIIEFINKLEQKK